MRDAPPTYSTIYASRAMTVRDQWRPFRSSSNRSSVIAPMPPPSYAQTEGISLATYSMDHLYSVSRNKDKSERDTRLLTADRLIPILVLTLASLAANASRFWSPRPTTAICPRCTAIIITTVQVRRSLITHAAVVVLFLCGCWPCCMIPYCMNSCKIIDHYCPVCRAYLGTYRPW
ncbi:lipopolysaccharide-induced tumor necrosis factor-alpha factor homolog [Ceratina calcarata]|uniref:Lipopolysaccharide-induced tumor necrosis factor-alpha factor homolog n=1 Tax=Ceratina calcarata TaxID=156304 RepID=A0AAJ7S5N5_9HYME|nr:lipopolysaccharide-induced tumor necrosis factor-alpha factor homolog [Ceratina calcarata]